MLDLLQRYPSPEKLTSLSEKKPATQLCKLAPRLGKRLAADITQALTEQTVVPGTNAAVGVLPRLVLQLITLRKQRDEVALEDENAKLKTLFAESMLDKEALQAALDRKY